MFLPMSIQPATIEKLRREHAEIETQLQAASTASDQRALRTLSQRYAELTQILEQADKLAALDRQLADVRETINSDDPDLKQLAEQELPSVEHQHAQLTEQLTEALQPTDPMDARDIIVEIRPGAGGDEAALFAAELFRMYSKFAEHQGWKTQILSASRTEIGGYKEVIFSINGDRVYQWMKHESGVHRVQRVPDTEKSGRVHTSTVTVAVVPEAQEEDLVIDPKDLKIVASTSTGAGGQSVNTTYSAIRVTHLPTGITVSMQDERSQTQNRLKAMQVLRSRLLAKQAEERRQRESELRKSQIGSGDRSEKIRTYNFPQDRVTDHRIKLTVHNVDEILAGHLHPLLDPLRAAERQLQTA